jgi:hypothetical protein
VPAALLVAYLAASVWLLPSWSWDGLWYHNPIAAYALQDHSLQWHDTPIPWVNSYPKNIELLSLWNVIFAPDDRLVDAVQLPLALMGAVALASLCRRAGASASLAAGLGLCWLLLPAVCLNIPSSYIDVACASLWLATVLFLARSDASGAHRFFGTLALGLYAGSKVTGALYAVLLAPVVVILALRQGRQAVRQLPAMALGVALLGGASYVRDWLRFGNPVWPVQVSVLGRSLPGTWDLRRLNTPPWGGPADLHALWRSFFEAHPPYFVDVRVGGFGPLWPWILMPLVGVALLVALARARRRLPTQGLLAVGVLLFTALLTPASWWGRYTLGIPAAGLLATAIVLSRLRRRWLAQVMLATIGIVAIVQAWPARDGFHAPLAVLQKAWPLSAQERDALVIGDWQQDWISQREQVVQPGDATVYDDSIELLYPLWRFDWRNRVLYRPWTGASATWLRQLDDDHARWAAIRPGSESEAALRSAGWTQLGPCPRDACTVWAKLRATGSPAVARP